MTDKIIEQIIKIRDSGIVNMFSVNEVQYLAYLQEYYELVCFVEDDRAAYVNFILTGNRNGGNKDV